jgi:aspartate-semialdehyde dehydrogenase
MTSPSQVVDNSSAFRMTEGVPLVIPEVNAHAVKGRKAGTGGIVANPNCSTIIALMAVTPLHRLATVKRMVVSTYQVRNPIAVLDILKTFLFRGHVEPPAR